MLMLNLVNKNPNYITIIPCTNSNYCVKHCTTCTTSLNERPCKNILDINIYLINHNVF